jgi:hypothetical protein
MVRVLTPLPVLVTTMDQVAQAALSILARETVTAVTHTAMAMAAKVVTPAYPAPL